MNLKSIPILIRVFVLWFNTNIKYCKLSIWVAERRQTYREYGNSRDPALSAVFCEAYYCNNYFGIKFYFLFDRV